MEKNPEFLEICVCETFETSPRMIIAVDLASLADETSYVVWDIPRKYGHYYVRANPTRGPSEISAMILSLVEAA